MEVNWLELKITFGSEVKSLTNVRACEPEPFFASLEPLLASHCFFSISFHFLSFLHYDSLFSSPKSI